MNKTSLSGILFLMLLVFFIIAAVWHAVSSMIFILPRYFFSWVLLSGLISLFTVTPAILLVGSAFHAESMPTTSSFHDVVIRELLPSFIFALILTIGYIFILPPVENRKTWFEQTSSTFNNAIKSAENAYKNKNYNETLQYLIIARSIDPKNPQYTKLYDSVIETVQSKMQAYKPEDTIIQNTDNWQNSNSLYLAALKAKEAGKLLNAHYLARRALTLNPNRKEIQALITETWKLINQQKQDPKEVEEAELFNKKIEGYTYYDSGRFLEAYQLFSALAKKHGDDPDIKLFLSRSMEQLKTIAFFIEEDVSAFLRATAVPFSANLSTDDIVLRITASAAVSSFEGVYFRDLKVQMEKPQLYSFETPFARLKGNILTIRAVDRENPVNHWEPLWKIGKQDPDGVIMNFPLTEEQADILLLLFQKPQNIPAYKLWDSIKVAERYRINTTEIYLEVSRRLAYPFTLLMVIIFGIGMGLRFRTTQNDSFLMQFVGSCILVPGVMSPLNIIAKIGFSAERLIHQYTKETTFILAWLAVLLCTTFIVIFISAKISAFFVRHR